MNATTPINMSELLNTTNPASVATATASVVDAEMTLAEARRRLHAQQRAMVIEEGDSWDLDQAVLEYRAARAAVEVARSLEQRGDANGCNGALGDEPPHRELGLTADDVGPEVRFARWLVEGAQRVRSLAA
ncbi:MAG: hypothetical protein M3442_17905 [Chloroflexota bacterium]|nr:hypothetical protein [Chloroflexota bacterium]